VKKKSLLAAIVILSVLLIGIGTSYAIYGVPDDVPGQDLVWPIICAKTPVASNSLNTNWAIADLVGGTPDANGNVATTACVIKTVRSVPVFDFGYVWTPYDVVVDDCESLVSTLTTNNKTALTVTIGGVDYYAGYVQCQHTNGITGDNFVTNRFMNNLYLIDAPQGFASGFNGPSLEDGSGTPAASNFLGEFGDQVQITAGQLFARYFINNTNANSWDWWILLMGRNEYNTINVQSTRVLNGSVCDEAEHCQSVIIEIPDELNIIDVAEHLPGAPLITTYPRAGFGYFTINEQGHRILLGDAGEFTLVGTSNNGVVSSQPFYSAYAWSYERAEAGNAFANYDVIHPMFRTYCSGAGDDFGPTTGPLSFTDCGCTGTGCP
jgi:hypothetical protein